MIKTNLLLGSRVSLRAMEPEDLEVLYTLENDTTLWDISSVNVPYSRYVLKQFIAKGNHDIYTDGQLRLMIESVEEGTVIGMVDLVDFNPRHMLEKYVSEFLHLHQLYAYISIFNEASLKLFKKAGYDCSCVLRDWIYLNREFVDVKVYQKNIGK